MIQRQGYRESLPEVSWREARFTSPKFVRCPNKCPQDIGCPRCHFWGTVPKGSADAVCVHDNRFVAALTSTFKTYQCVKCGLITSVDSSG